MGRVLMLISTPPPPIPFPPPVTGAARSKKILVLVCLPKMHALQPNITQDLGGDHWSLRYYYLNIILSLRLNSNQNLPLIFIVCFQGHHREKTFISTLILDLHLVEEECQKVVNVLIAWL